MTRRIDIKSGADFLAEVEADWTAIDAGEKAAEPIIVSRQRHHLLKVLHANAPLTVRALAALLERDYKNVHSDVKILEEAGLITCNGKNHILAPYEKLTIDLQLTA